MYDPSGEGISAKFFELDNGTHFTSRDTPGNVYRKTSLSQCKVVDFNVDDDLVLSLHELCGGVVFNIYNLDCDVDPDYDVLLYHRMSTCS